MAAVNSVTCTIWLLWRHVKTLYCWHTAGGSIDDTSIAIISTADECIFDILILESIADGGIDDILVLLSSADGGIELLSTAGIEKLVTH